ncbi:hypothetical protein B5X24_HaOG213464 [Helicoverpa armigera]|uniref:Dynein light chain n=1 Tax=Helicoverpa armigera TaxID=29058 RepID=A0A2W1BID5_HELAM|nr:dynein light chain Tctex-type protein 2B isoform X2 [Helicoverpa armigera]XP_049698350.1 dynein light chain Tctex-type protein 2B isoform X1 [Helicoverpa armigera]PZC71433.1 hypothetical protein B5X24_HaOG213464 [Helicoverpa armigera]
MADDEDEIDEDAPVVEVKDLDVPVAASPSPGEEKLLAPPKYEVRPGLGEKFQAANVREIILTTMQEQLMGRQYRSDQAPRWAKVIANGIRQRVQELDMKRYKIVVQTMVIEMKGAGVKCAQRCIWDPETDDYADGLYRNETIFGYSTVYGLYMY